MTIGESAYYFSFLGSSEGYNSFLVRVNDEIGTMGLPSQLPCRPDSSLNLITEEYAARLEEFALRRWIWRPGDWLMNVEYEINNNEQKSFSIKFNISERDVRCIREVIDHYQSGIGVLNQWRLDLPANVCGLVLKDLRN